LFLAVLLAAACGQSSAFAAGNDSYITAKGFPKSYLTRLAKLHEQHPNWRFTPQKTGIDWNTAVSAMLRKTGTNTIWYSAAPSYKSVRKGAFHYLTGAYSGGSFPAASKRAVKYYMDPRNFLNEQGIFMFENKSYSRFHTKSMIEKITAANKVLKSNASAFLDTSKELDISSVYLAVKSVQEIGTSTRMVDGHAFTYGGVRYSKCYNTYNIGSSDSAGVLGGLLYANGGTSKKNYTAGASKTYGRKWNSVPKAIRGGAMYLRASFIDRGQDTSYLEHFNVMNGKSAVGSHIYMSYVAGPYQIAAGESKKYKEHGIFGKSMEFKIPVYKNMPEKACTAPSSSIKKDNNYYLKTLTVKHDQKVTLIGSAKLSYQTAFTVKAPSSAEKVTIAAAPASKTGAAVAGTGTFDLLPGVNRFVVQVKASSGVKRNYTVTVTR